LPKTPPCEDDVHRHRGGVGGRLRRVADPELDPVEAQLGRPRPTTAHQLRVELHQAGADVQPARVVAECAEQVASIARADADDGDRTRRAAIERHPDLLLDQPQPRREARL